VHEHYACSSLDEWTLQTMHVDNQSPMQNYRSLLSQILNVWADGREWCTTFTRHSGTRRQMGLDLFVIRISFVSSKLNFVITKSVLSHKNVRQTFTFSKVKFCNDKNKFCSTKLSFSGHKIQFCHDKIRLKSLLLIQNPNSFLFLVWKNKLICIQNWLLLSNMLITKVNFKRQIYVFIEFTFVNRINFCDTKFTFVRQNSLLSCKRSYSSLFYVNHSPIGWNTCIFGEGKPRRNKLWYPWPGCEQQFNVTLTSTVSMI
jgi:hypothetical protein